MFMNLILAVRILVTNLPRPFPLIPIFPPRHSMHQPMNLSCSQSILLVTSRPLSHMLLNLFPLLLAILPFRIH